MAKNKVETKWNSPNYTPQAQVPAVFGRPRSIDYITIHWWGDPATNPTYEGIVSWFQQERSQVSAHDVITGTGSRVAVMVNYFDAAWHAGSADGNATSLGFECDPRCRPEDYAAVAQDVADTWKYYGRVIPLRPHKSWVSTACPGNYDLNKINQMAMALYKGAEAPKPATTAEVKQAYLDILERPADAAGIKHYTTNGMTNAQVRADLSVSQEKKNLDAKKAAEAAKTEWVKNLVPYTKGDNSYSVSVKLSVIPAEGVKVVNLQTGAFLDSTVIPKGTVVDVVAKTRVKGVTYLISSYSKGKGLANGIKADLLGTPVVNPPQEKPEWLNNLKDIADQDFWARSTTPVLKLADGTVSRTIPINTKVRITYATQVVGKDLLVLDGKTEAIETVYLSDTPIPEPDSDLEARITVLERWRDAVVKFFTDLFTGFPKK